MNIKDCFQLGKITKPFRYHGEVVLWMDVDDTTPYRGIKMVWVEEKSGLIPYLITKLKQHKDRFVAIIEGVNSEESAKALCGKNIYLPLNELPELDENHFYFHEVEGWDVFDLKNDESLGQIIRVLDHGPYPMLEVCKGDLEMILPLPKDLKIMVDRGNRSLKVEVPEGLIDVFTSSDVEDVDDDEIFPQ